MIIVGMIIFGMVAGALGFAAMALTSAYTTSKIDKRFRETRRNEF